MNPPTVFRHLAGSLTQHIRSNEPQLIFTRDEEIGSFQPTRFCFHPQTCQFLKSTWKIARVRAEQKQQSAQKRWEVSERGGEAAEERQRDKEPNRNQVWANMEEGGRGNQQLWQ